MMETTPGSPDRRSPGPVPTLRALEVMVGTWDLTGRVFTTRAEIRGRSVFEWLEGGFFLVHRFRFDYGGREFAGVEFIGYDGKSGYLRTHVFSDQAPDPAKYTWEVDETTFTNWFGEAGSDNRHTDRFSDDHNALIGRWEWPGGLYG